MRAIHLTDLDIATRVLLAIPDDHRENLAVRIIAGTRLADTYRKRLGRRHHKWGDGSLANAALAIGEPAPVQRCHAGYRRALSLILCALDQDDPFDCCAKVLYLSDKCSEGDWGDGQDKGKSAPH